MARGRPLVGRYKIVATDFMQEKAGRDDPRNVFYQALLTSGTYEAYLAKVGETWVDVASHPSGPISGRMEVRYCRDSGWIEDIA
jgi:hypothetical protein